MTHTPIRLRALLKKSGWSAFWSIFLVLNQSAATLILAYLIRLAFDTVIPDQQITHLLFLGIGLGLFQSWAIGSAILGQRVTSNLVRKISSQFQHAIMTKLYSLPTEFYGTLETGTIHTLAIEDPRQINQSCNALFSQFLPATILCFILWIFLVITHKWLGLILPIFLPNFYWIGRALQLRLLTLINTNRIANRILVQQISTALKVMPLTKVQGAQEWEQNRQKAFIQEWTNASSKLVCFQEMYRQTQLGLVMVLSIIILVCGGIAVIQNNLSKGELISFYVLNSLIAVNLRVILTSIPSLISGYNALKHLNRFLALSAPQPYNGKKSIEFKGGIQCINICFNYNKIPVLKNLDLEILPHQFIAITGANGSGKSTLLNLLLGLYRPETGKLLADNYPFTDLDLNHLRQSMGIVLQEPILLPTSILDNIIYGYSKASPEAIATAMNLAMVDVFCQKLPQKEHTEVGENGRLLSGGQRQRIAIARALVKQPCLLILDEPTNHLDRMSVSQIISNLKSLPQKPTVVIISHDSVVLNLVDYVYCLNQGRLIKENVL